MGGIFFFLGLGFSLYIFFKVVRDFNLLEMEGRVDSLFCFNYFRMEGIVWFGVGVVEFWDVYSYVFTEITYRIYVY